VKKPKSARKPKSKKFKRRKKRISEDEAFGLIAQEIVRQVDSGMKLKPFKPSVLDRGRPAELKLPKIDLKELRLQMRRNKKQRLEFLEYYAKRIKAGTA